MRALIKLVNIHFWRSIVGPFFAFGFPLIFVAILGALIGFHAMFAGLISLSSVAIALASMPQAIFEFKQSTLLKRIGVTPIRPWMFLITVAGYYVGIMIIGTIVTFLFSLAIFSGNFNVGKEIAKITSPVPATIISMSLSEMLSNTNWGGFIWGIFMCIIISTSLGMMIVSISKTSMVVSGLSVPLLITMQLLSGQNLPLDMLRPIESLWYGSYIIPLKPAVSLLTQATQGYFSMDFSNITDGIIKVIPNGQINIFDINTQFYIMETSAWPKPVFTVTENIFNLILPFAWTAIFSGVCIWKFKWTVR